MARAQHEPLRPVSDAEQRALTAISKATSERMDRVRRARAVLTVAETGNFAEATRQAGFRSVTAVTNLVQRFNQRGVDALTIAAGRGRKPTYDSTARAQIVQVSQTPPDRREDQQDEAGPYQAIPHPGAGWFPHGDPGRQPHEYVRGGTAKLLTLFRPATGAVRATGVTQAPNIVLHPWLQAELSAILGTLPERPPQIESAPFIPEWWERRQEMTDRYDDPPQRLILIWDNLAGHKSAAFVRWLCAQGILPLYTPLSGSWLNMAESVQRIIVRRALAGQHRLKSCTYRTRRYSAI